MIEVLPAAIRIWNENGKGKSDGKGCIQQGRERYNTKKGGRGKTSGASRPHDWTKTTGGKPEVHPRTRASASNKRS